MGILYDCVCVCVCVCIYGCVSLFIGVCVDDGDAMRWGERERESYISICMHPCICTAVCIMQYKYVKTYTKQYCSAHETGQLA